MSLGGRPVCFSTRFCLGWNCGYAKQEEGKVLECRTMPLPALGKTFEPFFRFWKFVTSTWTWPVLSIMSTKESDIDSNLLQLLFDTPTRRAALCEALSCEDLTKNSCRVWQWFHNIYICIIYSAYIDMYTYIYTVFFLLFSKFCNKEMQEEAVQPLAVWVPGSRLRYYIIENFITLRQAATGGVGVLYGARKARASGESSS